MLHVQEIATKHIQYEPPPVTPSSVIHSSGKVRVRHYCAKQRRYNTAVVLVYALIKRPFILDLVPGRSVVENLTGRGFEVFLTDWIPPDFQDSWRGFNAYVSSDLASAVNAVKMHEESKSVSVIGYCLGALLSVIYAALNPATISNLVTLTAPIDMRIGCQGYWGSWLDEYAVTGFTEMFGNCPDWLLRNLFAIAGSTYEFAHKFGLCPEGEREIYSRQNPVFRQWLASDVPLAGRLFRELSIDIFKKNRLARGEMIVGENAVNLRRLTSPLLNVVAESDFIVPPRSSLGLINLVGSADKANLLFPTGHLGVAISAEAHNKLWPSITDWLAQHDN